MNKTTQTLKATAFAVKPLRGPVIGDITGPQ